VIGTVALLLLSAVVIYLSCEAFVNGIEWVGRKTGISQTATGTILAAFGTALPESVVTLVATAFGGNDAQREIGIGAALGGPLALSTVAYAVVAVALLIYSRRLGRRRPTMVEVDGRRLSRDQAWFLAIFAVKIGLGFVVLTIKPALGFAFLAAYAVYLWSELRGDGDEEEGELAPLKLRPHDQNPSLGWAAIQTIIAMAVIFVASRIFVGQLEAVGPWLGLSPQVTALLLSPLATELPETMTAIIWVGQGKERLALANISGAMMIQATVPTAFGLFFTPWLLDRSLLLAASVTAIAIAFLLTAFRHGKVTCAKLSQVGWLYGVFAGVLAFIR
jgi:cation:H+ antiporter